MRFSRFFTETTQNFDRKYLWNYNSYGPVVWLIRSTISRGTKSRSTFFSYFQPFWRYMKITAHASRAKNRVTYISYRLQRVKRKSKNSILVCSVRFGPFWSDFPRPRRFAKRKSKNSVSVRFGTGFPGVWIRFGPIYSGIRIRFGSVFSGILILFGLFFS